MPQAPDFNSEEHFDQFLRTSNYALSVQTDNPIIFYHIYLLKYLSRLSNFETKKNEFKDHAINFSLSH